MTEQKTHKIFTYGSLMEGFGNNIVMHKAGGVKVKETSIKGLVLHAYSWGFPAATYGESEVHGEVYEVPQRGLWKLDELEGEGTFYHRVNFETTCGLKVQTYVIKSEEIRGAKIDHGSWKKYKEENKGFGFSYKPRYRYVPRYYSVWVGGTEVSDSVLTYSEAMDVRDHYLALGYSDVAITNA